MTQRWSGGNDNKPIILLYCARVILEMYDSHHSLPCLLTYLMMNDSFHSPTNLEFSAQINQISSEGGAKLVKMLVRAC